MIRCVIAFVSLSLASPLVAQTAPAPGEREDPAAVRSAAVGPSPAVPHEATHAFGYSAAPEAGLPQAGAALRQGAKAYVGAFAATRAAVGGGAALSASACTKCRQGRGGEARGRAFAAARTAAAALSARGAGASAGAIAVCLQRARVKIRGVALADRSAHKNRP